MKKKFNNPKDYKRLDCSVQWDEKSIVKSADGSFSIAGYANTKARDRVGDVVLPSAFEKTLKTYLDNPVLLYMHDWDKVIGKVTEASIDENGLKVRATISGSKDCEDVRTKIKEGILSTFSIGYNEVDADWDKETATNIVKEVELLEISIVSIPANTEAKFSFVAEEQKQEEGKALPEELITILKEIDTMDATKLKKLIEALKGAKSAVETATTEPVVETKPEEKQEVVVETETPAEEASEDANEAVMGEALKTLMEKIDLLSEGLASMLEMMQAITSEGKAEDMPKEEEEEPKKDEEEKPMEEAPKAASDDEEKDLEDMSDEEGLALLESLADELEEANEA